MTDTIIGTYIGEYYMNKLIVGTLTASAISAGLYFLGRPISKKRNKQWAFENILPRIRSIADLIPVHTQNGKHKS